MGCGSHRLLGGLAETAARDKGPGDRSRGSWIAGEGAPGRGHGQCGACV